MKVFITSAYAEEYPGVLLRRCAAQDRFGVHRQTDSPDDADLILFVEHGRYTEDPFYAKLLRHPTLRGHRRNCLMYNEHDRAWFVLPGVYCSMPASHFVPRYQRACGYLQDGNDYLQETLPDEDPPLLFSFIGTPNCGVRRRLLRLNAPDAVVRSARLGAGWTAAMAGPDEDLWRGYADVMARSRFVLCPRGHGTSTYRLFEAMRASRVPVILSDQWAPPAGPDWDRFSLRVPERDAASVPERLRREDHRFREMAGEARAAWEEWFAPDVKFHRIVEACAEILPNVANGAPRRRISRPYLLWAARVAARRLIRRR